MITDKADVIVTAGVMATKIVADLTKTIPIIQAFGDDPNITSQNNVTGFKIDAVKIAQDHLAALNKPVVVLYDDTPDAANPSIEFYNKLKAWDDANDKKLGTPLTAQKPEDLTKLGADKLKDANGFMLIPNAMFYNHCGDIADFLDDKTSADGKTPLPIIYPEREYKDAHNRTDKDDNIKVHGHHAKFTYRIAAMYVDSILSGDASKKLPPIMDAMPDEY